MKFNALNRKSGGNAVALAACLLVVMGWGEVVATNFTETQSKVLDNWNTTGTWAADASGYFAPSTNNAMLINKATAGTDGTFTITFNHLTNWLDGAGAGAVFRYSASGFYYITLHVGQKDWGDNGGEVRFYKNPTNLSSLGTPHTTKSLTSRPPNTDNNYKISIKVDGQTFTVSDANGTQLAQFTDNTYTSGNVGYGYGEAGEKYAKFVSSSWTDYVPPCTSDETIPAAYDGYLVLNTAEGTTFTVTGTPNWNTTGLRWSNATGGTTSCAVAAWATGNALFYAQPAAAGVTVSVVEAITFGNMDFLQSGYIIGGTSTLTPNLAANGKITVADGKTATISAVLAGSGTTTNNAPNRNITKAGAGTLVLSGTNTYSGVTTISAGTLVAKSVAALGATYTANNTSGKAPDTTRIEISNAAVLEIDITSDGTLDKRVLGSGTLTKKGTGVLVFNGATGSGTAQRGLTVGTLNVNDGVLELQTGTVTVNASYKQLAAATLRVGLGKTFSGTPTLSLAGTLDLTVATTAFPTEETEYTLFGGSTAVSTAFTAVHVNGTAWTKAATGTVYTNTDGDAIELIYTTGVKYKYIPGGTSSGYNITFNSNYGTTPATSVVKTGAGGLIASADWPADPVRTGFTFEGWSTTAAAGGTPVTVARVFTADATVYAQWRDNNVAFDGFNITFDNNDGTTPPTTTVIKTGVDSLIAPASWPENPVRAGYNFQGWYTVSAETGGAAVAATTKFTGTSTVYARWSEDIAFYTLIVVQPEGGSISIKPEAAGGSYRSGTAVTLKASVTDPTLKFGGWTGVDEGEPAAGDSVTITMYRGRTISAVFVPKFTFYKLTATSDGCGKVTRSPVEWTGENERDSSGSSITLTAELNASCAGYTFSHWTGSGDKDAPGIEIGTEETITIVLRSDSVVTAHYIPPEDLERLIEIDEAAYVDDSMLFRVVFKYIDNKTDIKDHYYTYELLYEGSKVASSSKPVLVGSSRTVSFPVYVDSMTEALRFETEYFVRARIVNSDGKSIFSADASERIEVGAFKIIRANKIGSSNLVENGDADDSLVVADNGRFILATTGWEVNSRTNRAVLNAVSVEAKTLGAASVPDGFVALGTKNYRYTVTAPTATIVLFDGNGLPFTVRMKLEKGDLDVAVSEIESGSYDHKDVRLYRHIKDAEWEIADYDGVVSAGDGGWYVIGRGGVIYSSSAGKQVDTGSYRLMINTKMPTVTVKGEPVSAEPGRKSGYYRTRKEAAVEIGEEIKMENIIINSNIANTTVRVVYAQAKNIEYDTMLTTYRNPPKADGKAAAIRISPEDVGGANNEAGVLVYMIVDNGIVSDTINMSRNMKIGRYTTATQDYNQRWSPLAARVHLKETAINDAFSKVLFTEPDDEVGEGQLPIDDTRYRLVRWLPVPNGKFGEWEYYTGENSPFFSMVNGRLMWLRTDRGRNFQFDADSTTSLTDTFTVDDVLKSQHWTDIMLPFHFNVRVKDILAASSGYSGNPDLNETDSLYFYAWDNSKDGKDFVATRLYVWKEDDSEKSFQGPFTVYNAYNRDITLRIPPRPAFLSGGGLGKKKNPLAKSSVGSGYWYYAISAAVDDASAAIAPLRLGYYETERLAPAPPTLGGKSAVILSDDGAWHIGDYLTPELSKGGRTFKLRFINNDRQKAAFKFSAESAGVPDKTQIMFVDALTGEIIGGGAGAHSLTVAGRSHSDVYAVIGSREYLSKTAVGPAGAKFAMGGVSVNQAARSVRVKYYVPLAGAERVEMSVYNLKGRLLWKNAEKVKKSSWNVMEWKSRDSRGGAAAAGLYIIRIRAINATGKTTAVENRKITFSR